MTAFLSSFILLYFLVILFDNFSCCDVNHFMYMYFENYFLYFLVILFDNFSCCDVNHFMYMYFEYYYFIMYLSKF